MERLRTGDKHLDGSETKRFSDVAGAYTYFAEGDVLLAKITPCFENGKIGIASDLSNGVGFGSSEFIVFRPGEGLDKNWLYYFLSRDEFRDQGAARMMGSVGHKRVAKEFIASYPIPIPPLREQRRIVAVLDEAFAGIASANAHAEQNLQKASALFVGQLQAIFTQRGKGWVERPLVEVCSLFIDSAHRTPRYQSDGIPALRPRDVANGKLSFSEVARVSKEEYEIQSKRHQPAPGDIVYSRELSYGWAAMLPESPLVCLSQGMCLFRPASIIDGSLLIYVLNSPIGREQAIRAAVGAAHPHINLGDIKAIKIPCPPIDKQAGIVQHLDRLRDETHRLESIYQLKLAALDELKQSLLHQAFSGTL